MDAKERIHVDEFIADLAGRQHGVVACWQLIAEAVGRGAIRRRLQHGRLHAVHRGVYAVGHRALSPEGRLMAAVLAGGSGAVLSHRSAAELWCLVASSRPRIEVTTPSWRRSREGLRFHCGVLPDDEITSLDGIPVTTVPRTLLDLAAVLAPRRVERAASEAEVRRLTDRLSLNDLLERYPGRRGTKTIKAIIEAGRIGADITKSELEELFLAFLDQYGLPRPELNVALQIRGRWIEVDCLWREQRVIVELDGRQAHGTAAAFESDRARDRALSAAGWRPNRVTWLQLHREPGELAADLHALLRTAAQA